MYGAAHVIRSAQRALDVTRALPQPIQAWAPEAFYDKLSGRTLIFWSTALGTPWTKPTDIRRSAHAVYYTTTTDFIEFADARPLLPPPPLGPSVIDASMAPYSAAEGAYFAVFKLEVNKTLAVASAPAADGPFTTIATDIAPGASAEGPSVVRLRDGSVVIYFDRRRACELNARAVGGCLLHAHCATWGAAWHGASGAKGHAEQAARLVRHARPRGVETGGRFAVKKYRRKFRKTGKPPS